MTKHQHDRGFSLLIIIFMCVVAGLLVLSGYQVYRHVKAKDAASNQTTSSTQSNQVHLTPDQAAISTRMMYIINYDASNHSGDIGDYFYANGYLTKNFIDMIHAASNGPIGLDGDPFICAQAPAIRWTYDTPIVAPGGMSATIKATGWYTDNLQGTNSLNIITGHWVKVNNVWQEDVVDCPGA